MSDPKPSAEPICTCGHERRFHSEEPPYQCFHMDSDGNPDWDYFDCDCEAFTYGSIK